MAKAAKTTIVEVEELVEPGEIQPHEVHVASVYVDRIVLGQKFEKRIERLTVREDESAAATGPDEKSVAQRTREVIAKRAALEFRDGMYGKNGFVVLNVFQSTWALAFLRSAPATFPRGCGFTCRARTG